MAIMNPLKMRADVMIIDVLPKKMIKQTTPVSLFYQPAEYDVAKKPPKDGYEPLQNNRWQAEAHGHCWLKAAFSTPALQKGERVGFKLSASPRGMQFFAYLDGKALCGMDANHTEIYLEGGKRYELYIYAYTNSAAPQQCDLNASVCITDENTEKFYYDLLAPWQVLEYAEEGTKEFEELLMLVNDSINLLDLREYYSDDYQKSVEEACAYLNEKVYGRASGEHFGTVTGVGHTHIDVQWMWRFKQTREKAVRSFTTVLYLMDRYPDYKFTSSQPALYKLVKEAAPEVYERIKERIKEGRWEAEGGMWLEADCNLTSGESLVRQFLYGKKFFKEEFGVESKILWLPDVFGYSAAMPQILRKSGVDTFVTSKISWNDTNQIPYDTFSWKGIDGTSVFTYFLTAQDKIVAKKPVIYTTYVGMADVAQIAGTYERYQQKNINDEVLLTFGWGDGGGGPTADMLEKLERAKRGVPFAPKTQIDTATGFISRVKEKVEARKKYLPEISGELYLEFHRGTYTTNAKIKRQNRKAEFALQNAELYSVLAETEYPKAALDLCWEKTLNNQFHDVLPGSSIKEVYEDTDKDYAEVFAALGKITDGALSEIAKNVKTDKQYIVFNPTSYRTDSAVNVGGRYAVVRDLPPKGYKAFDGKEEHTKIKTGANTLENEYYLLELNEFGALSRIYDKVSDREVLADGKCGNVLEAHQDIPNVCYEAWDIKAWHGETVYPVDTLVSCEQVAEGNRAGWKIVKKYVHSTIEQYIWLYDACPRIDFQTKVDWQERQTCLKVCFPTSVNARKATYEIQFGNVERPTTKNHSWEEAQFETCGQKWADVSDSDWGVALMNDCKYGHEISGGEMRLTLLRSPIHPNPQSDLGLHEFTYSLYAHKGAVNASDTQKQAYLLNNPPIAVEKPKGRCSKLAEEFSLVQTSDERVVVDTVKRAEDGNGLVLRLYETTGARVKTKLALSKTYQKLIECDLMENPIGETGSELVFKPFEIKTVKVL